MWLHGSFIMRSASQRSKADIYDFKSIVVIKKTAGIVSSVFGDVSFSQFSDVS